MSLFPACTTALCNQCRGKQCVGIFPRSEGENAVTRRAQDGCTGAAESGSISCLYSNANTKSGDITALRLFLSHPPPPPHLNWALLIFIPLTGGEGRELICIGTSTPCIDQPSTSPHLKHCQHWLALSAMFNVNFSVSHYWIISMGTRPVHTK